MNNDFGFSDHTYQATLENRQFEQVISLIEPFLMRLKNTPGDIIEWPQKLRAKQIEEVLEQLQNIKDS